MARLPESPHSFLTLQPDVWNPMLASPAACFILLMLSIFPACHRQAWTYPAQGLFLHVHLPLVFPPSLINCASCGVRSTSDPPLVSKDCVYLQRKERTGGKREKEGEREGGRKGENKAFVCQVSAHQEPKQPETVHTINGDAVKCHEAHSCTWKIILKSNFKGFL